MPHSTALTPFDNGEFHLDVTPHDTDGFRVPAEQIARALSTRGRDLVRSIPDAEKGRALVRTPGGEQESWYLTEAGFYRAIGQRQTGRIEDRETRAQVERFQSWVYGDVLPSIRRTGSYGVAALPDRRALAQMVIEAEDAKALAEAKVAELEPSAAAWESLADAEGDYSLREAAQILSRDPGITTGQNRLAKSLRELALLDRRGEPYQSHIQHVRRRPTAYTHPHTGEPKLSSQLRITVSGLRYLHGKLGGTRPLRLDLATTAGVPA